MQGKTEESKTKNQPIIVLIFSTESLGILIIQIVRRATSASTNGNVWSDANYRKEAERERE